MTYDKIMKTVYLALGSNIGQSRQNLAEAIKHLPLQNIQVSGVYQTAALLAPGALPEWNIPYLNMVVSGQTRLLPSELLLAVKEIEKKLGRDHDSQRWSPRPIDIDILWYDNQSIKTATLTVPHAAFHQRAFVLDPWTQLAPSLRPTGQETLLTMSRAHQDHQPVVMGIVNLSPDSFSNTSVATPSPAEWLKTMQHWFDNAVDHFDIGAQSTRPGAILIDTATEWQRLEPLLDIIKTTQTWPVPPVVSIDTGNPIIAERALQNGFQAINDVGGLRDEAMIKLAADAQCTVYAMHSLGLPADRAVTIPPTQDVIKVLLQWGKETIARATTAGIALDKLWLDPGIGFGKTADQSWTILRRLNELNSLPCRWLIGHSRKSFLTTLTSAPAHERDAETLALALEMRPQCDGIRVHAPVMHARALRASLR